MMTLLRLGVLIVSFCAAGICVAQTYPSKPIELVVGYSPGGSVDTMARIIAPLLSEQLKQSVIVVNRPGAGGVVGAELVAKSAPDGYTLLAGTSNEITWVQHVMGKLPYDPLRDLSPIVVVGYSPAFMVVNPSVPVSNARELLEFAKAKGGLPYASPGPGSSVEVFMELLQRETGIDFRHVPYRGGAPANADLAAGHVPMGILAGSVMPFIRTGRVRAVAVMQPERTRLLPDVPTFKESTGMETRMDMQLLYAFLAPAHLPAPVVSRLEGELIKILADSDVRSRLAQSAVDVLAIGADSSATRLRAQSAGNADVIRRIGFSIKK